MHSCSNKFKDTHLNFYRIYTFPIFCHDCAEKLIEKDGVEWCADVLDKFVLAEQSVEIGETVVRRYTPACPSQKSIVINIYSADSDDAQVRSLNI
jgi:hypothetical protein